MVRVNHFDLCNTAFDQPYLRLNFFRGDGGHAQLFVRNLV